ncbi:hypothetical protein DTL42_13320 [Bremerella cremea]|uniref:Uncharacterized protein n=1 Tax=Bremerella cremea TaxID=1031537 RepID=A0A368KQI5_9BACT|nr:hypothetical protein DTL42_13320 [Bremerella cremea]
MRTLLLKWKEKLRRETLFLSPGATSHTGRQETSGEMALVRVILDATRYQVKVKFLRLTSFYGEKNSPYTSIGLLASISPDLPIW